MELMRWFVLCFLVSSAVAQGPSRDAIVIEEELARRQREFAESESRLHRLHELRVRLDLGLPVQAEHYFKLTIEQQNLVAENGAERLLTEESEVQRLSVAATTLEERLAKAGSTQPEANPDGATYTIPIDRGNSGQLPVVSDVGDLAPSRPNTNSKPHRPIEFLPEGDDTDEPVEPTPDRSLVIAGSVNHSAVGRVLLRSGERLMQRAKSLEGAVAESLRARAIQHFEGAKRELELVTKGDSAELVNLYCLARCEEKLGNYAAADSLYAQIISRDHQLDENGKEVYGKWGRAAQASKSVLRWLQDTSGWKPSVDIEAIEWTKR